MKKRLFYGYHFPMSTYWTNYDRGGFTQISLDFSSRCNYSCDWCFNKHLLNRNEPDILTLNERTALLQAAVEMGAKTLVVPGSGEPTLDTHFLETIKAASDLDLITVVYSNLTGKVDLVRLQFMCKHNVSVGIKLDSFSQQHFESRYHTSSRKYEEFKSNLSSILEVYADCRSVEVEDGVAHRLVANMVLTRENAHEIDAVSQFCRKNELPLFVRPVKPVIWAREETELWRKIGNPLGAMVPEDDLIALAKKHNTLFSPSSTLENHCAIFSFGLTVKSNGDVQLCPDHHDSRGMYNIRTTSLQDVIRKVNAQRKIKHGYCVMLDSVKH